MNKLEMYGFEFYGDKMLWFTCDVSEQIYRMAGQKVTEHSLYLARIPCIKGAAKTELSLMLVAMQFGNDRGAENDKLPLEATASP